MNQVKKVRWVLAHEPIDLFLRAANRFAEEIAKTTGGALDIEVMTLSQYSDRYADGRVVTKHELLDLMESGEIEMSQMYTTTLGKFSKDMFALDMPFLFRDHKHAEMVLEGHIGQSLMEGLSQSSNIKGLAFTYSGGYRMIVANKAIRTVEDFKGLKIRIAKSPVAEDVLSAVGAIPVPIEIEELNEAIGQKIVDGGESTYPRYYSMKQNECVRVINDTQHSLFLTSILVSKTFWNTLSSELQTVFSKAAVVAANLERVESVADIVVVQNKCKEDGIEVVALNSIEQTKFKNAARSVYEKYETYFSNNLIKNIVETH